VTYAVILAGGKGTRFWPLSTPETPKQILRLFDQRTMIEQTIDRFLPIIPKENHRIVITESQLEIFQNEVHDIEESNLVVEPIAKNTAACIGLTAIRILLEDPDAVMVVTPTDHRIDDDIAFKKAIETGIKFVEETDSIVTIGIKPTRPATGYGYIQYETEPFREGLHRIKTFAEKPNKEIAFSFIKSGEFLWNSGIYIWSVQRILSEIEEHLPGLFTALMDIKSSIGSYEEKEKLLNSYQSIKPISIDYGVMEQAGNAYVVPGNFNWSDIGSWEEVYRISQKDINDNFEYGKIISVDSENSYFANDLDLPLAVVGLNNIIVVQTEGGTLICPRDRAEDVGLASEIIFKMNRKTGEVSEKNGNI
jgi:mannose-1-phosphate guanylyltransferase